MAGGGGAVRYENPMPSLTGSAVFEPHGPPRAPTGTKAAWSSLTEGEWGSGDKKEGLSLP